ncbi:MAG: hypothetical protein NUV31_10635 [Dehalococcoidales bacterium]|nr:hypothetical protein [Dehalococcoidales bacterium]
MDQNNLINDLFEEMLAKGLVSSCSNWIERAIEMKNPQLPLALASSMLLTYDLLDSKLCYFSPGN